MLYKDFHCPICGLKTKHIMLGQKMYEGTYHELRCQNNHLIRLRHKGRQVKIETWEY